MWSELSFLVVSGLSCLVATWSSAGGVVGPWITASMPFVSILRTSSICALAGVAPTILGTRGRNSSK